MGNFSAGTIFNIEWSGLDVGYSITVSNGHSLSELIGINSQLTLTSDWIPNAVIIIYIVKEDIGCVAPFGEITITVTTEDYILSNINNELIL